MAAVSGRWCCSGMTACEMNVSCWFLHVIPMSSLRLQHTFVHVACVTDRILVTVASHFSSDYAHRPLLLNVKILNACRRRRNFLISKILNFRMVAAGEEIFAIYMHMSAFLQDGKW